MSYFENTGLQENSSYITRDGFFMQAALDEAKKALAAGEVPVGAVVVHDGKIISRGSNSPIGCNDPTAHAEIVALRAAGQALGNYRLVGTELFVTVEPCIMCMGAIIHARVKRLVFGTPDPRAGAAITVFEFASQPSLNHRVEVKVGVLEEACRSLMQDFFKSRR
jgi:tRNA(adenine34) deaminase